jgi:uncharacterized lipoprotein YbaY
VVQVQLIDMPRVTAPASVLAQQTIHPHHQVPIPFEFAYDPSKIDSTHGYAVQTRITRGRSPCFHE